MKDEITHRIVVGGSMEDDADAFVDAWERVERGEAVQPTSVLAFESWEALAAVLNGERHRLLLHVRAHPAQSVTALARALGRDDWDVSEDVDVLERAGLLDRSGNAVRATAERVRVEV